ncbi:pyrimidine 5'-nucleotidase [Shumkonia mesophila]|uniref:pyrimidine 5'-nucleotidase n=1 Tax=Shumkonia mesophila TaxID=2838854 RepID=UPI0029341048|nr:pyrimidine 5'-nucleotidase [Shumkonia mesophila]
MVDSPPLDFPASPSTGVSVGDGGAWIFDLDNTLYPAVDSLFVHVSQRIRDYIGRFLDLDPEAAFQLQRDYFVRYGTSLRGMMIEHAMDPVPFLAYVHDVDLAMIAPNPRLDAALERLGGRKLIFTNASSDHAERVLERLGVARRFDAIFDIADGDFVPKPEPAPYATLVRRYVPKPAAAVMVDDIARNLAPAAALGMTTVWLRNDTDWGRTGAADGHVHHVADDLIAWLEDAAAGPFRRSA